MSYLVDALKKAERERHENQRADLRSLAGGGPASTPGGTALRWLVGILVACNAALLIYLFLPAAVSDAFVAPAPTVENTGASAPSVPVAEPSPVVGTGPAQPDETEPWRLLDDGASATAAAPAPPADSADVASSPAVAGQDATGSGDLVVGVRREHQHAPRRRSAPQRRPRRGAGALCRPPPPHRRALHITVPHHTI